MTDNVLSHYQNHAIHGPVKLFISDDGQILLRCDVDGMIWTMSADHPARPASRHVGGAAVEADGMLLEKVALDPSELGLDERPSDLEQLRQHFDAPEIWNDVS